MKKVLSVLFLLCILLVGCKETPDVSDAGSSAPTPDERALQVAEDYWGVEDGERDATTGKMRQIIVVKMPTEEDNTFIVVMTEEAEENWRTMGVISIDAETYAVTKMS